MISRLAAFLRGVPLGAFAKMGQAYRRRLARFDKRCCQTGGKVGILILPWMHTAVPFYSIEWGLALMEAGIHVEFLWDPSPCAGYRGSHDEIAEIEKCLGKLGKLATVRTLSLTPATSALCSSSRLKNIAFEARVRELSKEPEASDPIVETYRQHLLKHAAVVREFLSGRDFKKILLPGGVWGVSGVYWDICTELGIGLTTYDSGEGLICLQQGGPAAHFPEVDGVTRCLLERMLEYPDIALSVTKWVNERLGNRRLGKDEFALQLQRDCGALPVDVLVPLNYRIDTAAMGQQRLFSSVNEWLAGILAWARSHPHIQIVIRQHPCERIPAYRSKENYSWLNGVQNVRFVSADEAVNTYDLLERCRVVLPYTSRVGIEAAILGKPVVLCAHSYYENLDFVDVPPTRQAYFDAVENCLVAGERKSERIKNIARAAYFVTEQFTLLKTNFTPTPADFWKWVEHPAQIWIHPANASLRNSMISHLPATEVFLQDFLLAHFSLEKAAHLESDSSF